MGRVRANKVEDANHYILRALTGYGKSLSYQMSLTDDKREKKYDQFQTNKLNMNEKLYTAMVVRPVGARSV